MAAAEHLLVSKIIQDTDLQPVLDAGVRSHHLSGDWGEILAWVHNYWREHGTVPTERAFHTAYPDVQILDASGEPFSRLIEEIYDNYKASGMLEALQAAYRAIDHDGPQASIKVMNEALQRLSTETARVRDVDTVQRWEQRLAQYAEWRRTVNVLRGIPTGFAGLDRITGGLRPQQLITFVGEPKKGKSLIALIMAMAAHRHGKRPMFVSFEMSIEEQEARFDALLGRIPHDRILRGELTEKEMERLGDALRRMKNMQPFHMSEDTSSLTTVGALAGKLQQIRPDVLFVDGVYLMDDEQGEPKGSAQALTNITRSLKRLAQSYDLPIVITTQVLAWKLVSKTSRKITSDAIGYSSSFAQDSDLVLGVEANPDQADQSIIRVVLARSAPHGEVHINWDWKTMDFSEVSFGDDAYDDWG